MVVVLAVIVCGFEFTTDYGEALEGTPLVALPDGHQQNDGHDPAEHGLRCDNCHFGGVHLTGLTEAVMVVFAPAATANMPWQTPATVTPVLSRPERPPIA